MVYLQFNTFSLAVPAPEQHYAAIGYAMVATTDIAVAAEQIRENLARNGQAMGEAVVAHVLAEDVSFSLRDNLLILHRKAQRYGLACLLVSEEFPAAALSSVWAKPRSATRAAQAKRD
jgi:hypothetical protein